MQKTSDWVPIEDVAERLETTRLNVLMHLKRGLLQGEAQPGGWVVSRASLESFLATAEADRPGVICRSGCAKAGACGSCG